MATWSTVARFLYRFARPSPRAAAEREVLVDAGDELRAATAFVPRSHQPPWPAWVLLQGVTVPGRHHEALRRMARALAAAGHASVVPEVPAWTALRADPQEATRSARAGLDYLGRWSQVDASRVGLMGSSVAATWALEAAAGDLRGRVRVVAGMGGYGNLERMLLAMVAGEHEWEGRRQRYRPDPYGRWIMGANLLPLLEGDAFGPQPAREAAARALHRLALTAGRHGAKAQEPVYDSLITALRRRLPAPAYEVYDLLAPTSRASPPPVEVARDLAAALAEAGLRDEPLLDPAGCLDDLATPVLLLHGRADRLVPYTETLRLASLLPPTVGRRVLVTRLLGHTKRSEAGGLANPLTLGREAREFVAFSSDLLGRLEAEE